MAGEPQADPLLHPGRRRSHPAAAHLFAVGLSARVFRYQLVPRARSRGAPDRTGQCLRPYDAVRGRAGSAVDARRDHPAAPGGGRQPLPGSLDCGGAGRPDADVGVARGIRRAGRAGNRSPGGTVLTRRRTTLRGCRRPAGRQHDGRSRAGGGGHHARRPTAAIGVQYRDLPDLRRLEERRVRKHDASHERRHPDACTTGLGGIATTTRT